MPSENKKHIFKRQILYVPLFALLVSCIVIPLGLRTQARFRENSIALFQNNQLSLAKSAAQGLESQVSVLESQLFTLSHDPRIKNPSSPECIAALIAFYRSNSGSVYAG